MRERQAFLDGECGDFLAQSTKPQTIGYGVSGMDVVDEVFAYHPPCHVTRSLT